MIASQVASVGEPAAPPPAPAPRRDGRRLIAGRVLVAEDNPTNLLVLESLLGDVVGAFVSAADGAEAVAAFEPGLFDALLFDIAMPVMDGCEALTLIRAAERDAGAPPTPALAVTANVMPDQAAAYREAGFYDVAAKPIREAELKAMLEAAIEGRTA